MNPTGHITINNIFTVAVIGKMLLAAAILTVTLILAKISSALIRAHSAKIESALPVTSLTQNIARIIIYGVGILVLLNSMGVSVTPILATLGVGGLAVALALQDTLSNFFSGFHITVNKQVRIGDYVKVESGQEGNIIDINWRTTKIRTPDNNVALIPNAKFAQAIVINYHQPTKEISFTVNLDVHYNSDLEKVERITCEVARDVMKEVRGGVPGFEPQVRYTGFGDCSINFSVGMKARELTDQHLLKHEFLKRIRKRYAKEGIVIPYPTRTIHNEQ